MTTKVKLQLGDIIEIIAPNDAELNNNTYYIGYIDSEKIRLEEVSGKETLLTLTEGSLDNESIESIRIKSRATEDGYAKQNNLIAGVWIDIYFGGDLPLTLTGKITSLVEDKIEITTFPDDEVIFIDFAYKGLPEDLPIKEIHIRQAPAAGLAEQPTQPQEGLAEQEVQPQERVKELAEQGPVFPLEGVKELAEQGPILLEGVREQSPRGVKGLAERAAEPLLRDLIFSADQIKFGDELESITQLVDVPEEEQRYDIDKQLDDLLDDMLSTIPNAQRTDVVKNNIHKMIQRFQQLRDTFSVFDDKGYALMPKAHGANYKPLVSVLEKLNQQLYWLLPVSKTVKKIYNTGDDESSVIEMGANDLAFIEQNINDGNQRAIIDQYERNDTGSELNKYAFLQKELNPYLTPFSVPDNKADVILETKVNTTITALVDNIPDFVSSVNGHDTFSYANSMYKTERAKTVLRKKFALQTYNTGSTGLEMTKMRGENPIIKRKKLTQDETIDIKSLMTLPEPTLRFSRINLSSTNMLEKANMNLHFLNYWQLLKDHTHVINTTIKDFSTPYNHDETTFLKDVKNYKLDDSLLGANGVAPTTNTAAKDTYNKFLDTIIPKTKFLFNLIKPNLNGKLSINDILTYLEPFMVYQSDLTFMQYKEMNDYIEEKIIEYRKKYALKTREYTALKGNSAVILPSLLKLLDENPNLKTKVLDVYGFTDSIMQMSDADFIKHIIEIDMGIFYNTAIALISRNLMIADGSRDMADIHFYLQSGDEGEGKGKGKSKAAATKAAATKAAATKAKATDLGAPAVIGSDCNKIKVIAKRYIELDELNDDNGKEIFFDKKYDTTAYDIGEKFKADKDLSLADQIQHYIGKLMKNKGMDELNARRDAESIIKGKRTVEDGEHAILETTDEDSATVQYYIRKNETWILDDTIDAETFADDATMLCNLNEKCISVKETCQDQTTGANELKKRNLKMLLAEFETTLNVNKDIINSKIEDDLNSANARIEILRHLRLITNYKYELNKIAIANTLETGGIEPITSPYDSLLSAIMGQTDVAKRYLDISNFVASFIREAAPESDESKYWLYCIKTGKKMLPKFIYTLAQTFLSGGDFTGMLDQICSEQGTLSEDGDKWVDKYSGYTIKMINLNADEEYNEEGFKIISHAVLEADAGEAVLQAAVGAVGQNVAAPAGINAPRKYATPDATAIYSVIDTMSNNMGLLINEEHKDFIVRNVLKQLSNTSVMPSKAAYEKLFALQATKGKKIDTYEVAYNSTLLYLTFSYYLIAVQIATPPIKTKTTFPGCKKALIGFPCNKTDDMKALNYVACIAQKMKNVANLPWAAIAGRSATFIAKQMEINITKYILATEDVQNGIKELELYLRTNPESSVPEELNAINWSNFLPPLKPLKLGTTQDVGDVFTARLSDSIRKGKADQLDFILELQSKMISFSFNIIELIEKTVAGDQAILHSNSGEPFVENACCQTTDTNTLLYFVKKQPEIAILNNKVVRLSNIYDDTRRIVKAAFLYNPSNTRRTLKDLGTHFSEDTIYRAFIVFCKFNSLAPINENLKAICPTKPEDFDMNDSLEESIRKLKSNARNYNEASLNQLLDVINSKNKQTIKIVEKQLTNVERLSEIISKIDAENVRPSVFRASFMEVLEDFELNSLMEDSAQLRKFKNVLARLNEDMQRQIVEFVAESSASIKGALVRDFNKCIATLMQFKGASAEETGYKMVHFMKKAMRCLTKEFPTIILNKVNYENSVSVPLHWKLSGIHQQDVRKIIINHYTDLKSFYDDAQTELMMNKLIASVADINELAQNTLLYSPVEVKTKGSHSSAKPEATGKPQVATEATGKPQVATEATGKPQVAAEATLKPQVAAVATVADSDKEKKVSKYSAFDLGLTTALFQFYFFSVLSDLISFKEDTDVLQVPLLKLQESSTDDENLYMNQAVEQDILIGNQAEVAAKIVKIIVSFTNLICIDKGAIDYNYQGLMDLIMRSKEKEKDDITDYLGKMTVEERRLDDELKINKLGRWGKGLQKGLHSYDTKTYDEEREEMDEMARREVKLNKRNVVTDMNRNIFELEMLAEEGNDAMIEQEDNVITYMGEDAEPEDYDMDGDENF